jgi:uncharacterized protein
MSDIVHIPMFPLAILPLPGELVPLHIFEPRYRQLLQDAEISDMHFGIYFSHESNEQKIGSLMKLESVIKRYPAGEADIIVKCEDIFDLRSLARTYKAKMYPGGDARFWNIETSYFPGPELYDLFQSYLQMRSINPHRTIYGLFQIASELGLDITDRYKFLTAAEDKREAFILNRVKFQMHILLQEEKSKDTFFLN